LPVSHRKKNFRHKLGERDHITIVGENERGQVLECGVCKEQWPPAEKIKGRARFAHSHWMVKHVKCKEKPDA